MSNCPDTNCYECDPCVDSCPIKLDFKCLIYHKDAQDATRLNALNLPNGTNLQIIIDLVDQKLAQLNVANFVLTNLRSDYTISSLQQFAESTDTVIGNLQDSIETINDQSNVNIIGVPSSTVNITTSGSLNHTITADVKVASPASSNCLTVQPDGLVAVPQTLAIDYATKKLTISKGNTINLAGLFTSSYLGDVAIDPSGAINGNYWYNTAQSKLKIRVNNTIKEILTA